MDKVSVTVKVFFAEPFWIGIVERVTDGKLSVCKITFGAEPCDGELSAFFQKNYYKLRFSPAVETTVKEARVNPKRMQRKAQQQLQNIGTGTRSQQALSLLREQQKTERKAFGKEQKEAEALRKFSLKQQKKKEKHRGR